MHLPDEPLRAQLETMKHAAREASRDYEAFRSLIQRGLLSMPESGVRHPTGVKKRRIPRPLSRENEIHSAIARALAAVAFCFAAVGPSREDRYGEFMVPSRDPGIRSTCAQAPEGRKKFSAEKILLFVHGATYPPRPRSTCG